MLKRRPEIDGLRAVAVVPVILFHAGFSSFDGGYIGVDVFFVISGYLITTIIISEKESGTFTLLGFYERRARRILPALIFVVMCSLPFAWVWMLPYQLESFAKGVIAVSLFSSNILFWWQQGYFSDGAELNPILHTWSLAVEEQYYIFFPLALLLAWPLGKRWLIGLFATGALASLLLAQMGGNLSFSPLYLAPVFSWHSQPTWASFYLPVGRAWELLLGGMVGYYLYTRPAPDSWLNHIASIAGLLLITASLILFDKGTQFPSFHTLLPTVGTALILLFATHNTIVAKVLSLRFFVGLGLISYSAYLWHQPMFAFSRLRAGEPDVWTLGALSAASVFLAYFSWRYVEKPFRNRMQVSRRQLVYMVSVSTVFLIAVSTAVIFTNGAIDRYPESDRHLVRISPRERSDYVEALFGALHKMTFSQASSKKLVIVGDSYAQDFVNMVGENDFFSGYEIRTAYVPARCQLYVGDEKPSAYIREKDLQICAKSTSLKDAMAITRQADVVILVASWNDWIVERLPETIENMNLSDHQRLVVVGSKSFGTIDVNSFIGTDLAFRQAANVKIAAEINGLMRKIFGKDAFVDIQRLVCGAGDTCPVFTPEGELISYDGGHLTKSGARFVGQIIFEHPLLSDLK